MPTETPFKPVLETPELGPGELREVRAHGRDLVLLNIGQTYYALDSRCPRSGTRLGRKGRLEGDRIVCPDDGAAYDVRTGEPAGDGGAALRRYAIRVEGNKILVGPPLDADD